MKRIFYILILTGFSLTGFSQVKPSPVNDVIRVVKLYPNPATSYINFEFDRKGSEPHSLVIFSFIGKKVDDIRLINKKVTVSLNEYYRGIYIFQIRDASGNIVESGKFQVAK